MKSLRVPIGSVAPDFVIQGNPRSPKLLSALQGRTVVLVFYRGHWCQSCRRQLAQLDAVYETMQSLDAELIAISADSRDSTNDSQAGNLWAFPVVSDTDLLVIDRYGVRDDDDPEGRRIARPATFLLDPAGIVRFCHIGAHRQDRPAVGSIMLALESLAGVHSL